MSFVATPSSLQIQQQHCFSLEAIMERNNRIVLDTNVFLLGNQKDIALVDKMIGKEGFTKPHPGFQDYVGWTWKPGMRFVEGSNAANFEAIMNQAKGGAFLKAYETLKGGGQITEIEGQKATDAITRMSKAQNEEEFKIAGREFQDAVQTGLKKLRQKSGGEINASPATPPPQPPGSASQPKGKIKFLGFE